MDIEIDTSKSVSENANAYFEKAKKLKSKLPGINNIIEKTKKEIEDLEKNKEKKIKETEKRTKTESIKKEWFEKFRFSYTTNGFLCVLGKDAASNEVLIKKHMEKNDIVLHSVAPGSPFCLIKGGRDKVNKKDLEEAAQIVLCFSKQWKSGFGTGDAFWVYPEQVSKKAQSGEYIGRGAFMISGKQNTLKNIVLKIALGIEKKQFKTENGESFETEKLFSGPVDACKKKCKNRYMVFEPGNLKYKEITKEIKKQLKIKEIEDLPKFLPEGVRIVRG